MATSVGNAIKGALAIMVSILIVGTIAALVTYVVDAMSRSGFPIDTEYIKQQVGVIVIFFIVALTILTAIPSLKQGR